MNKNALISLRGIRVDFEDNYLAHHRRIYPTQGG